MPHQEQCGFQISYDNQFSHIKFLDSQMAELAPIVMQCILTGGHQLFYFQAQHSGQNFQQTTY